MKRVVLWLAVLMCLLLSACGDRQEEVEQVVPTEEVSAPVEPSEEVVQPPEKQFLNPLTGLPIEEAMVNARPVAVMLNNLKKALPQQGNGDADIIYEVVAEGGITRMLGVYQSLEGVDTLASIRSARPYYIEIALGHDALYVHAGGSTQAYEDLADLDVDNMDGVWGKYSHSSAGVFWRERERIPGKRYDFEHSLVTSGEAILAAWADSNIPSTHEEGYCCELDFAEDGTPAQGENAAVIEVPFSNYKTGLFRYDADLGVYAVEEYGNAYIDGNTGEQVTVTNVLVLRAPIRNTGDSEGHMKVDLSGGDGWFACGGKVIPITWEKGDARSPFRYYTAEGTPLMLGQGKSYVNIIADSKEISFE